MQILLVEPYHGGSHRAWAEGYAAASAHEVRIVSHPARWWKWRMQGSAVTLAEAATADGAARPDVVLVSDMTDVAALRWFLAEHWGRVPTAVYFHESQLTYPDPPGTERDERYAFLNWTAARAADLALFNSGYHRRVFWERVPALLERFPDLRHTHLVEEVEGRSEVLPVGVDLSWARPAGDREEPPLVMWNHRWEHDKDPETFLAALTSLAGRGVDFRVALCGEGTPTEPEAFAATRDVLGRRIVQYGHAPRERYRHLLLASEVIVSTARQEFFGISVVEGCAAGAMPVLPARLSYPGLVPPELHESCLYPEGGLEAALEGAILDRGRREEVRRILPAEMRRFDWSVLAPAYDERLARLAGDSGKP
jgi:glycosyltransferase involved in cell wall biosynthesis